MSPQFVDFDADGHLDIVAGIYDGSPHLVRGSAKGWGKPEQILDRDGARIVFNQWWNFDTKKWEKTERCDPPKHTGGPGHLTSAIAFDIDADGDLDLLLGDHMSGRVYSRRNEGTASKPAFTTINEPVLANGKPIEVAGTVATLRLVDWNRDGRQDLAIGSMGDSFTDKEGGGVLVYLDVGKGKVPELGAPIELLARSKKDGDGPTRPDSGIYMDFGDHDGDGDLDMVVGGYSHWKPKPVTLTDEQKARVAELQKQLAGVDAEMEKLMEDIQKAVEGLDEETANKKRDELYKARSADMKEMSKRRMATQAEIEPLVPSQQRVGYVWLYENVAPAAAEATAPTKQR